MKKKIIEDERKHDNTNKTSLSVDRTENVAKGKLK
jgi:hypothetical protein